MYIRNRYDRKENLIKHPDDYVHSNTKELQEFLDDIYCENDKIFDQIKD